MWLNASHWFTLGNSKLANILFTRELAERVKDKSPNGKDISTFTLHPGIQMLIVIVFLIVF